MKKIIMVGLGVGILGFFCFALVFYLDARRDRNGIEAQFSRLEAEISLLESEISLQEGQIQNLTREELQLRNDIAAIDQQIALGLEGLEKFTDDLTAKQNQLSESIAKKTDLEAKIFDLGEALR